MISTTSAQRLDVVNNVAMAAALTLAGTRARMLLHEGSALRWIAVRLG
jgi:hypothetical protein